MNDKSNLIFTNVAFSIAVIFVLLGQVLSFIYPNGGGDIFLVTTYVCIPSLIIFAHYDKYRDATFKKCRRFSDVIGACASLFSVFSLCWAVSHASSGNEKNIWLMITGHKILIEYGVFGLFSLSYGIKLSCLLCEMHQSWRKSNT